MDNFFVCCLKRSLPLGLLASIAAVLLVPAAANATPYVVKLVQQGSDVVATGSGSFDLDGLVFDGTFNSATGIVPNLAYMSTGSLPTVIIDSYTGFTGPATIGSGTGAIPSSGSGDYVGIIGGPSFFGISLLFLPAGYTSGEALWGTTTYGGEGLASLDVTPGTYVWTWGSGADQSFTLDVGGGAVDAPEPAAMGTFIFGMLLIGAFAGLCRRIGRPTPGCQHKGA
jgi:hypothetical protein